jgi:ligand-binding sensor domain-containing protein
VKLHQTLLASLLLGAAAPPLAAQDGRYWQPDERFIISDFAELGAVASDMRRVYAASPNGIQIYDAIAERWERPVTLESGFPAGRRPTALAHEPGRDLLWLGTAEGDVFSYSLFTGRWDSHGFLSGGVQRIIVSDDARQNGVFFLAGNRWYRAPALGGMPSPVNQQAVPAGVQAQARPVTERIAQDDPAFRSFSAHIAMDQRFRRYPIVDAAPGQRQGRWWLATRGGNLFLYDGWQAQATPLAFGAVARAVTALAYDGVALWFGGDGRGPRRGVSRGGLDLQDWRAWYDDEGAPPGETRAIHAGSDVVWFAASDGLYRLDRRSDRWRRITEREGLLGDPTALAPGEDGRVWVGTRRGVALVGEQGEVVRTHALGARRVHALHAGADTLWIATEDGLLWLPVAGDGTPGATTLRGRVVGVTYGPDGALWVAAEDALFRRGADGWQGPLRQPVAAGLGRIAHLTSGAGHLWVGGSGGIARLDEDGGWTMYRVGQDLPEGPVTDIVITGEDLWAATRVGAVRLRWRP